MLSLATADFQQADVDYGAILPMLIVFGGALIGVLVEGFAPRRSRHSIQTVVSVLALAAAFFALAVVARNHQGKTLAGSVVIDGPALFLQGALLLMALLSVLMMAEKFGSDTPDAFTPMGATAPGSPQESAATRLGLVTSEVMPLTLFSVGGMMLFTAAGDLLTMFVALEVLSLPLYILSGLARRRRLLSQEASLKYFLLGSFSSAFFLFGAALLYGYAGSVGFAEINKAITTATPQLENLLLPGILFVLVGVLFKVGAVPFHSWTPDVYQGAPSPVTGFMAACTKLAAFGALLRLAYVAFDADRWSWRPALVAVAALTMVLGAILTVTQTDVKRLLAYSAISHAGFILVGVLSFDRMGVAGVMFYLVAYGFSTIAAFAIISMVRAGGSEATQLSQWAGLGKREPFVAVLFAFLMMSMAGIPLTAGFTAKFAAFAPAVAHGDRAGAALVIIGVLASAVTAFVYFRVIVLMFFNDTDGDVSVLSPSIAMWTAIILATVVTIVLGVFPGPALDAADQLSQFVR
ncbi:NADH-quinone oxidoreductase subunit NuoN [Actinomycetota bacterium]